MQRELPRRLLAELLGSAFLAAVVIGSGIAAQQLSPGDTGLELLENAAATAAGLFTIILMFGPVSGGHFNPVVSLVDASFGGLSRRDSLAYVPAQIAGCILGAIVANGMFALSLVTISTKHRATGPHFLSEIIATLGLLLLIFSLARTKRGAVAPAASAPTSEPPTSSPAPRVSPIRRSASGGRSPTPLPESLQRQSRRMSWRSWSAVQPPSLRSGRSTRTSHPSKQRRRSSYPTTATSSEPARCHPASWKVIRNLPALSGPKASYSGVVWQIESRSAGDLPLFSG